MKTLNHRHTFVIALKSVNAHLMESMDMLREFSEEYKAQTGDNKQIMAIVKLFAIVSSLNSMCVSLQEQLQEIVDITPKDVLS